MSRIKRFLGFCQVKGCWNRSTLTVENKEVKLKRYICEEHFKALLKTADYIKVEEE